ncbi:hypothetical protein [Streptomyces sp. NPDC002851]
MSSLPPWIYQDAPVLLLDGRRAYVSEVQGSTVYVRSSLASTFPWPAPAPHPPARPGQQGGHGMSGRAVLYVCIQRFRDTEPNAEERAIAEGREFAAELGLEVAAVHTDTFGEKDPVARPGWQAVRGQITEGDIEAVITRWPESLSPRHELRFPQMAFCRLHSAPVRFSWPPLRRSQEAGMTVS